MATDDEKQISENHLLLQEEYEQRRQQWEQAETIRLASAQQTDFLHWYRNILASFLWPATTTPKQRKQLNEATDRLAAEFRRILELERRPFPTNIQPVPETWTSYENDRKMIAHYRIDTRDGLFTPILTFWEDGSKEPVRQGALFPCRSNAEAVDAVESNLTRRGYQKDGTRSDSK